MRKKIYTVFYSLLGVGVATTALASETGLASYYSDKFQGRKTASGQRYDRNKLTAAHRSLPLGSQIEIINLQNHSSVIVTVNDRGPYNSRRKLDLSYAAAKELGLDRAGVAKVSFELVEPQKNSDFENAIPAEFIPLEFAKSEEELLEAEEESIDTQTVPQQTALVGEQNDSAAEAAETAEPDTAVHHKKHHLSAKNTAHHHTSAKVHTAKQTGNTQKRNPGKKSSQHSTR